MDILSFFTRAEEEERVIDPDVYNVDADSGLLEVKILLEMELWKGAIRIFVIKRISLGFVIV